MNEEQSNNARNNNSKKRPSAFTSKQANDVRQGDDVSPNKKIKTSHTSNPSGSSESLRYSSSAVTSNSSRLTPDILDFPFPDTSNWMLNTPIPGTPSVAPLIPWVSRLNQPESADSFFNSSIDTDPLEEFMLSLEKTHEAKNNQAEKKSNEPPKKSIIEILPVTASGAKIPAPVNPSAGRTNTVSLNATPIPIPPTLNPSFFKMPIVPPQVVANIPIPIQTRSAPPNLNMPTTLNTNNSNPQGSLSLKVLPTNSHPILCVYNENSSSSTDNAKHFPKPPYETKPNQLLSESEYLSNLCWCIINNPNAALNELNYFGEYQKKYPEISINEIIYPADNPMQALLMLAAEYKRINVAEKLIQLGANVNIKNVKANFVEKNKRPISFAACNGDTEMVELFIKHNAIVTFQENGKGHTVLHFAIKSGTLEMIKAIIERDMKVLELVEKPSMPDKVKKGRRKMSQKKNQNNETLNEKFEFIPLDWATSLYSFALHKTNNEEIKKYFKDRVDEISLDLQNSTHPDKDILLLSQKDFIKNVEKSLKSHDPSAHHYALRLLKNLPHFTARNPSFSFHSKYCKYWLVLVGASHNLTIANFIFDNYFPDPNVQQKKTKHTALMLAAENGDEEMVKLLLSHDANVLLEDTHGHTALHHAIEGGSLNIIHLLIKKNNNILNSVFGMSEYANQLLTYAQKNSKNQDIIECFEKYKNSFSPSPTGLLFGANLLHIFYYTDSIPVVAGTPFTIPQTPKTPALDPNAPLVDVPVYEEEEFEDDDEPLMEGEFYDGEEDDQFDQESDAQTQAPENFRPVHSNSYASTQNSLRNNSTNNSAANNNSSNYSLNNNSMNNRSNNSPGSLIPPNSAPRDQSIYSTSADRSMFPTRRNTGEKRPAPSTISNNARGRSFTSSSENS